MPKSAIILGGGVIGVEFASAWKSFGADVTIVEGLKHLVPVEDENSSKLLERAFRKRGISSTWAPSSRRPSTPRTASRSPWRDGKEFEAEVLLVAIGRGPVSQGLGYEEQASPWTAATSWSTSTCAPTFPPSPPSATWSRPSSSRTSASPRASWWRSAWPA
ncbi:hypothetical protein GCM10023238_25800 [Streptomyces heliomycini]